MDQEIIGYLHSGDTVEIVEKCGDWYKVNFNGKTGYAHGKYLNVTDSTKDSSMFSEDALKLFLDLMQSGMSSEDEMESSTALTPEGNMTLVDDIGEEEDKSSQQFITLVTKAGNTFYLIIDRDKDGNQNVHFLNMVDEADLLALMDEEEAAKYQEKKPEVTEPAETEKPQETEPAPVITTGSQRQQQTEHTPAEQERQVNRRALFPGRSTSSNASSQGSGAQTAGNRGHESGGDGSSTGTGTGNEGISFDLKGRRAIGSLPKPAYESNDAQGIVIIEITVDAQGRVQNTAFHPQGSTTQDARLLDAALQAARQARFSPSEANAVQTGTITYVFRLQ